MQRSTFDCNDPQARAQAAAAAAARPGRMLCGFTLNQGVLNGGSMAMSTLASILARPAGRPVVDRTGLTGTYDIDLKWTAALAADARADDAVSIFTAVQEQLGLKLESGTAPLDVVVVERVQQPSEN